MPENKQTGVDATVEEILRSLDAMTKADPVTDPDERSPGSGEPAAPMDAPPPAPGGGDGAPPEGQESLEEIYASMQPEELEEHMAAIQKVMAMKAGAGPEGSPAPSAPAPSPSAPPPAPMMRSEAPMAKSEVEQPQVKGGHFHPDRGCEICAARDLEKAEHEKVEQLSKSQRDTEAKIVGLANAILPLARMMATGQAPKPLRKSVENISDLAFVSRGEPASANPAASAAAKKVVGMKPDQVAAILNEKIPTLAKAERDRVSAFYEGRIGLSEIAHLLVA